MVQGKANIWATRKFLRMLEKLPRGIQERAVVVSEGAQRQPTPRQTLECRDYSRGIIINKPRSVKIWDYRLIYIYVPVANTVIAYYIGYRRNIYRNLR